MKLTPRKYAEALVQALEAAKDPKSIFKNFLALLRRRKQFKFLPKILKAFESLWATRRGILKMKVSYPPRFQDSLPELEKNLSAKLGKEIEIEPKPEPSTLGGFRLQFEDILIDATMQARLRALARRLNN